MTIERICLLGLGEVGAILARDLLDATTAQLQVWDHLLDDSASPAARHFGELVDNPRVARADGARAAAAGCQLVLSAVTADQAVAAATSVLPGLPVGCWFVDLNSVSPGTKTDLAAAVEGAGGWFVEAAVMSPIMPKRTSSPVLLAGPRAADFEPLGRALGFSDLSAISAEPGVAAATKMCRSVMIKGMEALVSESLLAARHYGVDAAVLSSLNNLFPRPDWPDHARYLISRTLQHGTRRAAEMREVARTVSEAGIDPWMSEACVLRQDWAPQFSDRLGEETLDGLLDAMLAQLANPSEEND
ncbi:MAG: 6-phosphogluconate dehydrogenase [Haliea sp.]|uniref:NAD(P)-dependent oxidoreductase n=1 Tax=Haliea sp. TaxID=1932666 RepID=UPI000C5C2AE9|nr:NAD(P)-dependent oxidoreductase [Haliea sp.]MBM68103.1 6-phosphogluconate dehydrogenase [Haliea sp.]|tara:strand:- start:13037 stop:13942 length:906 start_codon:yes stop_codon:yes gene_type:complete